MACILDKFFRTIFKKRMMCDLEEVTHTQHAAHSVHNIKCAPQKRLAVVAGRWSLDCIDRSGRVACTLDRPAVMPGPLYTHRQSAVVAVQSAPEAYLCGDIHLVGTFMFFFFYFFLAKRMHPFIARDTQVMHERGLKSKPSARFECCARYHLLFRITKYLLLLSGRAGALLDTV